MKKIYIIKTYIVALIASINVNSCDYLDVVPIEQADLKDMMIDNESVLRNLYSCYGYIQNGNRNVACQDFIDWGSDEIVMPQEWLNKSSRCQWNSLTPSSIDTEDWSSWYDAIGYCNQFLQLINVYDPVLNPNDREQYIAEVKFLKAYYHFRALQLFGPIPIIDNMVSPNISKNEIPGRSHFDFCVDYIVNLLDEAAEVLPAEQTNSQNYGRATSVICKALKAKVLLFAASPLWNGDFPFKNWENKNYETPGYGKALVSLQYDQNKWVKARDAFEDAIKSAENNGAELFNIEAAESIREKQKVTLPTVPGNSDEKFRQRVLTFRYINTTKPDDGNKEIIWGICCTNNNIRMASVPHYVLKNDNNVNVGGWGGASPTLYTVEHFYTKNGLIPSEDKSFKDKSLWLKSANLSNYDIININVDREARFYAWISFDGDEYSSVASNRQPLVCEMRNPQKTGYDATVWGTRNYSVTGFLNKKWVHPNFYYTGNGWGSNEGETLYPASLIRLGELYLGIAECDAHLGNSYVDEGLTYLNYIRKRAGVFEWNNSLLSENGKSLLDAVMEERFVELYFEGNRYYDIRRYVKGDKYLGKSSYRGLNSIMANPSFSVFNTEINIAQPFEWDERMYLMPIPNSDLYSNPQMIQSPGY